MINCLNIFNVTKKQKQKVVEKRNKQKKNAEKIFTRNSK